MTNTSTPSYELVCGLEVHAELKTNSKMFCGCKNDPFNAPEPNSHTCPVCLGMPGGLPVANKKAIEWTIKLGLALGCEINLFSKFDRKHYFYPDLPKGYQISQYDIPFCVNGVVETSYGPVRIRRIHLEEDTGKLLHKTVDGKKVSLIDFNRGGVPLVEIVTEPDIKHPAQAKEYGKKLRQLLRYLDIADCDMEQGGMRLEANISLKEENATDLPNYKVEVKNINSFRFLEQAIGFEIQRQTLVLMEGKTPAQETRGWNATHNTTVPQRTKEDAEDYRYFPDPDLPPLHFTQSQIDAWKLELPELPELRMKRWHEEYNIDLKTAEQLIDDQKIAAAVDEVCTAAKKVGLEPNKVIIAVINKKIAVSLGETAPNEVIAQYQAHTTTDSVDSTELGIHIAAVIAENPDPVARYRAGQTQLLNFFVGQVMRKIGKKINVEAVKAAIEKEL